MDANAGGGRYTALRRALWAGFALAIAATVGAAAWMIDLDRRLVAARVERESQNLRMTLSADLRQAMARVDGYLLNTIVRLPPAASPRRALSRYLADAMEFRPLPEIRALLLLDGDGRPVEAAGAAVARLRLPPEGPAQLAEMRGGTFLSAPVAGADGAPLVLVSRPVSRDGGTAFLAAALDIRFFQNLLPVLDIGSGGGLAIVRVRGTRVSILARRPAFSGQPAGVTRDMTAQEIAAARTGEGKFSPEEKTPDGVPRELFYGNLEGWPLFVLVGIPTSEVSAEIWRTVAPKAGLALFILVGGSALFWVLLRQLRFAQAKEADEARARLQAQRSEERFGRMFRLSPNAVMVTSLGEGRIIDVNDAMLDILGRPRDEIVGRTTLEVGFWRSGAERAQALDRLRLEKGGVQQFENTIVTADGKEKLTIVTTTRIDLDGEDVLLSMIQDVTEKRQAERLLGESEARLAKLIEASPEAITIGRLDDGVFVEANPACEQLSGYTRAELIGRNSRELGFWPDLDEREHFFNDVRRDGMVTGRELRLRRKDGEIRYLLASAAVIEFEGRKLMMFQAVDITDRKSAEARAQYLATQDPLTGLPNRVLLMDRLAHAISAAQRLGSRIAVFFVDLDRFKTVNDSLGHHVGDQLLKEVAARIGRATRKDDTFARLGGDEFVLVAEGIHAKSEAEPMAKKILEALASPFAIGRHAIGISASIGIVAYPDDASEAADLLRAADIAMYRAKESGRNCFQFFSAEMNVRVVERQKLENRLRQALESGTLQIHYQPKIDVRSRRVAGAEALLRWRDAELGEVPPGRFVAVAEETGLILSLGRWVIERVTKQIHDWHGRGLKVPVAVNLSVRQFGDGLVEEVAASLKAAELESRWLEMEITESVFLRGVEDSERIVQQLAALGVAITIDDFGTGYSSLSYLKRFSVHGIKVDRSFVHDIVFDPQDVAIVRAIVAMAHSLGVRVIAEGVETETQLAMLRELGCDEYQGYLCSRALAPAEFEKFVASVA